jgi:hypothetical protein
MKAVVLSLACCCILSGSGELLFATPPVELSPPTFNRPQSSRRTAYDLSTQAGQSPVGLPVQQAGNATATKAGVAPITDRKPTAAFGNEPSFDIAEPSRTQEAITRPWEVNDSPRPLKAPTASRMPNQRAPLIHTAELAGSGAQPITNSTSTEFATQPRPASPSAAGSLVSPASPARPAPRTGSGNLLGNEAEYRGRDGFTFSVRTTNIAGQTRTARSITPQAVKAPRPLEVSKPAPTKDEGKTRSAAAPRPLATSSNLHRTAPARWFRSNPLRDSNIAQTNLRPQPYVQQTSAQSPEGESYSDEGVRLAQQPPATENLEDIPSIGDEQPLPFDLNSADKEAAPPAEPAEKMPAEEKASPPLEDDLSLDDLPFNDTEKKAPAEPKKPVVDAPAAEANPNNEPSTDTELPFPFDVPAEEKKPAETAPMNEVPADKAPMLDAPADEAPVEDLPFGDNSAESMPDETPAAQPTVTEANEMGLKSILDLTTSIAPPTGELPADRFQGSSEEAALAYCPGQSSRGWSVSEYNWKATGMFHQPLYFEEVNLERYGYSHGIAQPAISYGQFLVNVIAMPYKVMAEPPREEIYTLGQYRPGSYAPYRINYPPASVSGGLFEAGVVIGLVFLIP